MKVKIRGRYYPGIKTPFGIAEKKKSSKQFNGTLAYVSEMNKQFKRIARG